MQLWASGRAGSMAGDITVTSIKKSLLIYYILLSNYKSNLQMREKRVHARESAGREGATVPGRVWEGEAREGMGGGM